MFQQLQRKITFYIVLPSILLSTSVFIIFSSVMFHNSEEDFIQSNTNRAQQKIQLAEYYLTNIQTIASELSVNEVFVEKIKSPVYDFSINPILRYLKNSSAGIAGVSAYSIYPGSIDSPYHVSDFSSHPSLDELSENQRIATFFANEEAHLLSIRTDQIASSYFNNVYDPKFGIITFLYKLYDTTSTKVGYLVVDINPYYFHNEFFFEGSQSLYQGIETYIVGEEHRPLFVDDYDITHYGWVDLAQNETQLQDHHYLILSHDVFDSDYRIVSLVPLSIFTNLKTQILFGMFVLLGMVNTLVAFIAWKYAGQMTNPILQLKTRMAHTNLK